MEEQRDYHWSEATINDYYSWAWTTANRSNLKQSIHPIYEEVVSNYLNPDLFETASLQGSSSEDSPKIRKRLVYEKIVSPLKRLYEAYQDDWEIQSVPVPLPSVIATTYTQSAKTSRPPTSLSRERFTVAILCALPLEIDAVTSMFDEFWDENIEILRNAPNDSNAYTIGSMGGRMVVLVHMPGMGKIAASQSASSLRSTYPNIKLALVVGICGSTPHYDGQHEIILGDVVISEGIVQYDFGRLLPGAFRRKELMPETLGRPTAAIRSLVAKMKTKKTKEHLAGKIVNYLQIIDDNLGGGNAQYPGISKDELFLSNYTHKHYKPETCAFCNHVDDSSALACDDASEFTCEQLGCQKDKLISRKRLRVAAEIEKPPTPMVHIGLVGSGDTVMKSGLDRDRVASRDKVIAFEMEGAGVWDVLPCIVIKGVCDYADSHKNKVWQRYAAATGAACMRAVLELWTH